MSAETQQDAGTVDKVVAWLLYVVQLAFELLLLLFLVFSVMAGDACGTGVPGVPEPRICSGTYFATLFYGYALVLLVAALATPALIRRADRLRWLRPVLTILVLTVLGVVYMALLTL